MVRRESEISGISDTKIPTDTGKAIRRFAVISDIHGNRAALEAVLQDIRTRDVTSIINLGDSLYGPLDPAGTAEMLIDLDIQSIRGNEDRVIIPSDVTESSSTLRYVQSELKPKHLNWLSNMPAFASVDSVFFACHGTPRSDTEYLFWDVRSRGAVLRKKEKIEGMVKDVDAAVILCAHDHVPNSAVLNNGTLVVNPGSVGLQAFLDDIPYRHIMQNRSPHARYAVITEDEGLWHVEHREVSYDWAAASILADANGRSDWAYWLRTGKVGPD